LLADHRDRDPVEVDDLGLFAWFDDHGRASLRDGTVGQTGRAATSLEVTKMWSAASMSISAVSPPEPTSTPSVVATTTIVLSGTAPTRRSALIRASSFCISSEMRRTCTRPS